MTFTIDSPFTAIPGQRDETPEVDGDEEISESVSSDAPYGYTPTGRVRKRPVGSRAGVVKKVSGASNEKLARQAAKTLVAIPGIIAIPAMIIGLQETAAAMTDEDRLSLFEEQIYAAVLPDPSLCREILRTGGVSSKLSLILATLFYVAGVATVAVPEIKELRAERKARAISE